MDSQRENIARCWAGEVHWDTPMAQYSSLRVGGPAEAIIMPDSSKSLAQLLGELTANNIKWEIVGRGSNILVSDRGINGVVVVLAEKFSRVVELETKNIRDEKKSTTRKVYVEAGCSLPRLTKWCVKKGISGLEFASGIPGSVGGAVVMNAGAWGVELCERIDSVELVTSHGELFEVRPGKSDFSYRSWVKKPEGVVVSAVFNLETGETSQIKSKCQEYDRCRKEKQPQGVPSVGSFFKNPTGVAAGALIESAGLKGNKVGGAMVSKIHANFLVNTGNASALDFFQLMQVVQREVYAHSTISLQPEVCFLGEWDTEGESA